MHQQTTPQPSTGRRNFDPIETDHYRFMQDSIAILNTDGGYTVYPSGRVGDSPELYCDGSSEQAAKEDAWKRCMNRMLKQRKYQALRREKWNQLLIGVGTVRAMEQENQEHIDREVN